MPISGVNNPHRRRGGINVVDRMLHGGWTLSLPEGGLGYVPPDGGDGDGGDGERDPTDELVDDIRRFLGDWGIDIPEDVIRTILIIDGWGVRIAAIGVGIGVPLLCALTYACQGRNLPLWLCNLLPLSEGKGKPLLGIGFMGRKTEKKEKEK